MTNNLTGQLWTSNDEHVNNESTQLRLRARRRQWLTILFAALIALIASHVSAQPPDAPSSALPSLDSPNVDSTLGCLIIHYDDTTHVPVPHSSAAVSPWVVSGGAVPRPSDRESEPAYVEVTARLANFDADADPDGWRPEIVIRDQRDRPIVVRSQATFTLMPRESTINENQYLDGLPAPVRWSVPLEFDPEKRAQVKLPLRKSLRTMWGWSSAALTETDGWIRRPPSLRQHVSLYGRRRSILITERQPAVGVPPVGQLNVRVAIPTQGAFAATTPVQIRPPALVDTTWPYR